MANIFLIHGSFGHPNENWFPWLKGGLEKLGCRVFAPQFPTPPAQSLENWLKTFEDYRQYLNKDTIFIGHSLGPAFILSILEKIDQPAKAGFFVSGFLGKINNPLYDRVNETFMKKFDWQKIKQNCGKFYLFHSDNDPYVPLRKAKELAKNLGVEINLIKGGGHLNEKAGYLKFELLLEEVKKELQEQIAKKQ